MQEALLRAWRHADRLEVDGRSLRPRLFTVAGRNAALSEVLDWRVDTSRYSSAAAPSSGDTFRLAVSNDVGAAP